MDNHRPIHLANSSSGEYVTVFVNDVELNEEVQEYDSDLELSDDDDDEDDDAATDADSDSDVSDDSGDEMEGDEVLFDEVGNAGEVDNGDINEDEDEEEIEDKSESGEKMAGADESGDEGDDMEEKEIDETGADDNQADCDKAEVKSMAVTEGKNEDGSVEGDTSHEIGNEDDEEDVNQKVNKRRRLNPMELQKNQKKMYKYYYNREGAETFSPPTAYMLLKLVHGRTGGQLAVDVIWQAILGVTDQLQRQRIPEDDYNEYCDELCVQLSDHLLSEKGKYTVGEGELKVVVPGAQTGHIEEGPEFRFFLFKHWSLFESMCYSPYVAAKLSMSNGHGTGVMQKLQELLAKMGVPLDQCKQTYNFMAPAMKEHFKRQIIGQVAKEDFGLVNPDTNCRSFFRYNSFKNPVSACDVVHSATALVEICRTSDETDETMEQSRMRSFDEAYDCLGMRKEEKLKRGIQISINLQKMIVRKASVLLEDYQQIRKFKYCYHVKVSDLGASENAMNIPSVAAAGSAQSKQPLAVEEMDTPFTRPMVLTRLGQYIMDVKMSMKKRDGGWVEKKVLPLFLIGEERRGKCLIVGISPSQSTIGNGKIEDETKEDGTNETRDRISTLSNFKAFYNIAVKEFSDDVEVEVKEFDYNIIEVPSEIIDDFVSEVSETMSKVMAAKEESIRAGR